MTSRYDAWQLFVQRRFVPYFGAMALGAFNDNLFKNVLVLLVTFQAASFSSWSSGVLTNVAAALFVLPFVLFSAAAGQLADSYHKPSLIRFIKLCEIGIMVIAGIGLLTHQLWLLLLALFAMGTHSAFFGPVKYGILPEILSEQELIAGNAWVEMGTFLAILLGTLGAAALVDWANHNWVIALSWVAVALLGYLASRSIPATAASHLQSPAAGGLWQSFRAVDSSWRGIASVLVLAKKRRSVWQSILGISWFWLFGSVLLAQLPVMVKSIFQADIAAVSILLAAFSLSVGIGSILCERISAGKVEIGVVPLGSLGLSWFGIDIWFACQQVALPTGGFSDWTALLQFAPYRRVMLDLMALGLFGGLFIVPLYSLVQLRTPKHETAQVIAANNILNALFMVVGAMLAAIMVALGLSVIDVILAVAICNAAVAIYIYRLVPEFVWRFVIWLMVLLLYRVRKSGLEHVPDQGRAVLICNHVSFVDAVIIATSVRRPIRFVMDWKIFKNPVLGWLFRTANAIPIAPKALDEKTYEAAFEKIRTFLGRDELVCIFPEGKITWDGEMNEFKTGILRIMEESPGTPIVPMAVSGLWGSPFSRKIRQPWRRVSLVRLGRRVGFRVGQMVEDDRRFDLKALYAMVLNLRGHER